MTRALQFLSDEIIDELDASSNKSTYRPQFLAKDISSETVSFSYWAPEILVSYAELDTSKQRTDRDAKVAKLLNAIEQMRSDAPTWDARPTSITRTSADAARLFLACLPENRDLPKVAADGEGDVMFVWDGQQRSCIVTVEDTRLHLVADPGKPTARHIDASSFYGAHVPVALLEHIPSRQK